MSKGLDPDQDTVILLVLIWVQTVCNSYQQLSADDKSQLARKQLILMENRVDPESTFFQMKGDCRILKKIMCLYSVLI